MRITDDRGKTLHLARAPRRIVSLVPSDTYSLIRLGVRDRLVGRTRYCVAPADDVAGIEVVGGTKDADVDRIVELSPDLVVANQEENARPQIVKLEQAGLGVFVSFPRTMARGIAHLARLAVLLGIADEPETRAFVSEAYRIHAAEEARRRERTPVRTFVPIWMNPLMTAHGNTFLSDVLDLVGAQNVFADRERRYPLAADLGRAKPLPPDRVGELDTRYPRVTFDEVEARQPELILLPDEPHPFTEADAEVFRELHVPAAANGRIVFCDGKDLMWYGARSLEGLGRLRALVEG